MKSGFKRTFNLNEYHSKVTIKTRNLYLNYLIDQSFQGVKRLSVLSSENTTDRTVRIKYYLPTIDLKDYNVMIDRRNFFDEPVKYDLRTHDNIQNIATGQVDDCTASCLPD